MACQLCLWFKGFLVLYYIFVCGSVAFRCFISFLLVIPFVVFSCVGVREDQSADVEEYHCPNCTVKHGPLLCKCIIRSYCSPCLWSLVSYSTYRYMFVPVVNVFIAVC